MEKAKMILCDTDVIIEFYRNNTSIVSELKKFEQDNIAISVITAGELLFGAFNKIELKQIQKDIASLNLINLNPGICGVFLGIMEKYVLSHKLALPDGFIAATAIYNDIKLFSLNVKDYAFIDGLQLYYPRA